MSLAMNYYILLLGRIVTGLGVGVSFVVVPVYISEITPSNARGMLSTCFDISINIGILLGYIIGYLVVEFGDKYSMNMKWRVMIGFGLFLPIIVMFSLYKLPESPRWLMSNGKIEEAKISMTLFLGNEKLGEEAIEELMLIIEAEKKGNNVNSKDGFQPLTQNHYHSGEAVYQLDDDNMQTNDKYEEEEEKEVFVTNVNNNNNDVMLTDGEVGQDALTWREVFTLDPLPLHEVYSHKVILLVVCVGFWQQSTGSEAILYYSSTFLEQAGLKSTKERLLG